MRITFKNLSVPTRAAKRLKALALQSEHPAREITARVLGYANWHELHHAVGQGTEFSVLDEDLSDEDFDARRLYQISKLGPCLKEANFPMEPELLLAVWRPSSARPQQDASRVLSAEDWAASGGDEKLWTLVSTLDKHPRPHASTVEAALLRGISSTSSHKLMEACRGAACVYEALADREERAVGRQMLQVLASKRHYRSMYSLGASLLNEDSVANAMWTSNILREVIEAPDAPDDIKEKSSTAVDKAMLDEAISRRQRAESSIEGLRHFADEGHSAIALHIGQFYDPTLELEFAGDLTASGVQPRDFDQALKYYRIAAAKGNVESAEQLGLLLTTFDKAHGSFESNMAEGARWLKYAENKGAAGAKRHLAELVTQCQDTLQRAGQSQVPKKDVEIAREVARILAAAQPMEFLTKPGALPGAGEGIFDDDDHFYSPETVRVYSILREKFSKDHALIAGKDMSDNTGCPFVFQFGDATDPDSRLTGRFETEAELTAFMNEVLEDSKFWGRSRKKGR